MIFQMVGFRQGKLYNFYQVKQGKLVNSNQDKLIGIQLEHPAKVVDTHLRKQASSRPFYHLRN